MNFTTKTENKIKSQSITQLTFGEISEYLIKIEFSEECSPSVYSIVWEEDQIDMYGFWSSKSHSMHNLTPDWNMRENESRTATGMPLVCIYSKSEENRLTISLSDPASPTKIMAGVVEENACLRFQIDLFSQMCPKMKEYEVTLRIDRRGIPFSKAIIDTRKWWSDLGFNSTYVPKEAALPMYSCWYSFHQHTIPDEILYELKIAKALGMDTVIVDDGWQTDDNNRGYAFCGDWKICEKKIPSMQDFVDRVHELGMKFMIWFSVPFVGFESENYERFRGKYLLTRHNVKASVLDPRYPEVRKFLTDIYCDYVSKYGWDGLKLDFIDSFRFTEESQPYNEEMDTPSVEVGLQKLLAEATERLRKINPEILIEFRQSYIGPIVSQYGNLFRVTDCPNDAYFNRIGSLDLRLTSDKIPVHSDMLMWNKNDTDESVMYQLLAIMFCVPQISVRFDNIAKSHRALLKNFLSFWREHCQTLLNNDIYVEGVDANYTLAKAQKDGESVAVLYQNSVLKVDKGHTTYAFNSIGKDGIYIENSEDVSFVLYDMFGEMYAEGILKAGVNRLDLKNCGMAAIKSL